MDMYEKILKHIEDNIFNHNIVTEISLCRTYYRIPYFTLFEYAVDLCICAWHDNYYIYDVDNHLAVKSTYEDVVNLIDTLWVWSLNYMKTIDKKLLRENVLNIRKTVKIIESVRLEVCRMVNTICVKYIFTHTCNHYSCGCRPFTIYFNNPMFIKLFNNKLWTPNRGWTLPISITEAQTYITPEKEPTSHTHTNINLRKFMEDAFIYDNLSTHICGVIYGWFDENAPRYHNNIIVLENDKILYKLICKLLCNVIVKNITEEDLTFYNEHIRLPNSLSCQYTYMYILDDKVWNSWLKKGNKPKRTIFFNNMFRDVYKRYRSRYAHSCRLLRNIPGLIVLSSNVINYLNNLHGTIKSPYRVLILPFKEDMGDIDITDNMVEEFGVMIKDASLHIPSMELMPEKLVEHNKRYTHCA